MNKLKSRKFFAWVIWSALTFVILWRAPESIAIALPLYAIITGVYIGSQAIIDYVSARGVR